MTRPPPLQRQRPPSRKSPPTTAALQTSDIDPAEKQLMALGYKLEMHHGEKLFCSDNLYWGRAAEGRDPECPAGGRSGAAD
jgi:hypothetical protein